MLIVKPIIFNQFADVVCGVSTKVGENTSPPFNFNLSLSVGDDESKVIENRKSFCNKLGFDFSALAYQKQVHGDDISIVSASGFCGESDAIITKEKGIAIAISTADCTPIFIFDRRLKIIAGIHSGWRSTQKKITSKTINTLKNSFDVNTQDLYVYIGPSISQSNYEVGIDVAELFDSKYVNKMHNKFYLNVSRCNYDMLVDAQIPEENIQYSNLCTFNEKSLLHSYRREGSKSGRAIGIIYMRNND